MSDTRRDTKQRKGDEREIVLNNQLKKYKCKHIKQNFNNEIY
jgi:hypothetical protein